MQSFYPTAVPEADGATGSGTTRQEMGKYFQVVRQDWQHVQDGVRRRV